MKKRLLALFMGTSLALAACGGGEDTAKEPAENDAAPAGETSDGGEGEQLFQQSCASCHGNNLEGGVGPNLTKVGNKYSEDEIENIILNGQGSMPKGLLKGEDATKVAEWLATQK